MYACDPECFKAFERLLAQPDPPEMPRRAHVYSCGGEPERRATRLPAILMAWLQRRHLDVDVEEPCERRPSARVLGAIYPRLQFSVVENDREEGAVDLESAVVLDESE